MIINRKSLDHKGIDTYITSENVYLRENLTLLKHQKNQLNYIFIRHLGMLH